MHACPPEPLSIGLHLHGGMHCFCNEDISFISTHLTTPAGASLPYLVLHSYVSVQCFKYTTDVLVTPVTSPSLYEHTGDLQFALRDTGSVFACYWQCSNKVLP